MPTLDGPVPDPTFGLPAPVPVPRGGSRLWPVVAVCAVVVAVGGSALVVAFHQKGTAHAGGPAGTLSASGYRDALQTIDRALAARIRAFSAAHSPGEVQSTGAPLASDLHDDSGKLAHLVPPAAAATYNRDLSQALDDLSDKVGMITTSASDYDVCTGASALSVLAQSNQANAVRTVASELATVSSDYAFGTFLPAAGSAANRRLANGQLLKKPAGGQGELDVKNQGTRDAIVTLAVSGTSTASASVYVQGGQDYALKGIADGTYDVYLDQGYDWDADLRTFSGNCSAARSSTPMTFATTRSTYRVWTLTLGAGNSQPEGTTGVDPADVPS